MTIPSNYFERLYSGWIGKLAGIRSGAPIEGWTYEKIRKVYGVLDGYPANYKNFAADDDSNGPVFFVRALDDCADVNEFSSQDVANALLNYSPYEHGFFWWGGYGISTEHTAYLNLVNGIPAPRSGSIEQNGFTVAEQIGGQIFIDPWGLIAPNNPELAAKLATFAASVTHDGNGIYGGVYIAVCISLAFGDQDIKTILKDGLNYIPDDCEYARVAKKVMDFYEANPEDWRACYEYIYVNFGYDKYPGACHIIPNSAIMILSMLYGEGDFTNTLNIINMCGWDTDCNAGNVGCIMGIYCGLEGIDYVKWQKPINDFIANSGVVPSLNAIDAPYYVSYLANQAYRLAAKDVPDFWHAYLTTDIETSHFEYPTSTHAFRLKSASLGNILNTTEESYTGNRSLKVNFSQAHPGESNYVYKQTHYRNTDFSDSRYDPSFSPLAYPGQTVEVAVKLPSGLQELNSNVKAEVYALNGANQEEFRGDSILADDEWHELTLNIPGGQSGYISEVGVVLTLTSGGFERKDLSVYIDDLKISGNPDYIVNYAENGEDLWHGLHREINQFSRFKGLVFLENEKLHLTCSDRGEIYSGHHNWTNYKITTDLTPQMGNNHFVLGRVQGACRAYYLGFNGEGKVAILKNHYGHKVIAEAEYEWQMNKTYEFEVTCDGDELSLTIDGTPILSAQDSEYSTGGFGMSVFDGSHSIYTETRICSLL